MDIYRPNQSFSNNITSKNSIPTGVKGAKLQDLYLKEVLQEQDKGICLIQDKYLAYLQQRISIVSSPLCYIGSVIQEEKEACPPERMSDDCPLSGVSILFDQVVLPSGKAINSCSSI